MISATQVKSNAGCDKGTPLGRSSQRREYLNDNLQEVRLSQWEMVSIQAEKVHA